MGKMIITDHAYMRMRERMGIKKSAGDRISHIAYERGISLEHTSGRLRRYIEERCSSDKRNSNVVRIYGEYVYCFFVKDNFKRKSDSITLITVYRIPNDFKCQVLSTNKRQKLKKIA